MKSQMPKIQETMKISDFQVILITKATPPPCAETTNPSHACNTVENLRCIRIKQEANRITKNFCCQIMYILRALTSCRAKLWENTVIF